MNRKLIMGGAITAVLLSAIVGYRIGVGRTASTSTQPAMAEPTARTVLYWKDPDGKNEFSPTAKKTTDGRDYLPVYDDQEAAIVGTAPVKPKDSGKPLYYRNPMGLADTSPVPKKDSMGMEYIPVFADEGDASTVKVSLDRVQRSGVRSEPARMQNLARPIRVPGVVRIDERRLRVVTLRADGYIEKLHANVTGQPIKLGQPLFRFFSPQIISAGIDYQLAVKTAAAQSRDEAEGYRRIVEQRLRNLGVPEPVLTELRATGRMPQTFDMPSPVSGVVIEKKVLEGMRMKAGDELYRIADVSSVWIIADVPEQDLGRIQIGAPATLTFRAYPNAPGTGLVTFIAPELERATRSAKVRIEVANADGRLGPEMFADVEINAGEKDVARLVVPVSAVIDSGNRQVVIIDKGEGRFEPRPVKLGLRGDSFIEILEGIKDGEQVVTTANFLIDAESNLKAALKAFTAAPTVDKMAEPSMDKMGAKP